MAANGHEERAEVLRRLFGQAPAEAVTAAAQALTIAATDKEKAPFVTRALHALAEAAEVSSKDALLVAASARSDTLTLLRGLATPDMLAHDHPFVEVYAQGIEAQHWILETEGGTVTAEHLGRMLRLSRQAIDKRRRNKTLIALPLGRRGFAYPLWQIQDGAVLPGLDGVLGELAEFDPWTQAGFMLNPNTWLDGASPLEALRRGKIAEVQFAAAAYAE
ncbi:MAG: hypothetical protein H0W06_07595 [Chloroflexia bacterium]|nr:hypothetical protein [Chloroflexia bacterium]